LKVLSLVDVVCWSKEDRKDRDPSSHLGAVPRSGSAATQDRPPTHWPLLS